MWSLCVVVFPPLFDDYLCFPKAVEDFSVEQFISEPTVKALAVSMLPWTAWFDVGGLSSNSCNLVSDSLNNELRAVVTSEQLLVCCGVVAHENS